MAVLPGVAVRAFIPSTPEAKADRENNREVMLIPVRPRRAWSTKNMWSSRAVRAIPPQKSSIN